MEPEQNRNPLHPSDTRRDSNRQARAADPLRWCPRCSAQLDDRQCKLVCDRCGYYMSCSDFY